MNKIFSVICDEPAGKIERSVYQAEFTPELIQKLWEKQKKYKTLMGREILTFDEFLDFFVAQDVCENCKDVKLKAKGICYIIDDCVGVFWLSDICWPAGAEVHYTFFDGRHRGRLELVKTAVRYAFEEYGFMRLYVRVALYAKYPLKFVESLGFKKEGRMRKVAKYRGIWYDANCYSLLREEI